MMREYNCVLMPMSRIAAEVAYRMVVMCALLLLNVAVYATSNFVGGGGDQLFSNPANWQSGTLPIAGDNIDIEADCIYDLNSSITYGTIKIRDGATLTFLTGSETFSCETLLDGPSNGTLDMSLGGTLRITDQWLARPGKLTFVPGGGTVEFHNTSSASSFPDDYLIFNHVIVAAGTQVVQLENDVHLSGDLTIESGTLDSDGFNISLSGDWTDVAGQFDQHQALVHFTGCDQTFTSSDTLNQFYDLTIQSCACVSFNAPVEVLGTFTVSGPSVCDSVWANNTDLLLQDWHTKGNIIVDSEEFLGTLNDADLRVKTNDTDRLVVKNSGEIGIGTLSPTAQLDVDGGMRIRGMAKDNSQSHVLVKDADGNLYFRDDDTFDDADNDPTNEIETWSTLAGIPADIADGDDVDDADNDPTNEIETWSTLSGIPADLLDGDQVDDADNDPANEYNSTVSLVGTNLEITDGGGTISTDLSGLVTPDNDWTVAGSNQYSAVSGNVGIGTTNPTSKLEVAGGDAKINNITVGKGAGSVINNTVVGQYALSSNTSGHVNSAFGSSALLNNTTGTSNTALGFRTLEGNTTGSFNSAVGIQSQLSGVTGKFNNSMGVNSMLLNQGGQANLAIGYGALYSGTAIYNNVALGHQAGWNTQGSGNIFLGSRAGYNETGSNKLYIDNNDTPDPLIWGDFASDQIRINGSLGIGNQYTLPSVNGTNGQIMVTDSSGNVTWQTPVDNVDDADNDPTNEIETWSTLSGIPEELLDGDQVDDADSDPTNEFNTTLELVGQELRLTDGGGTLSVQLNSGADSDWTVSGSDMYSQVTGNVGVGTSTPSAKLDVNGDSKINGLTLGRGGAQLLSNTALGYQSLQSNTSGSNNTGIGFRTLENNSTGDHNVAIGRQALIGNTTGGSNISIGSETMFSNQNGSNNIAIGMGTMTSNTSGRQNAAVGDRSLFLNTSGFDNVAFGSQSLYSNSKGRENTAIGYRSLFENQGGSRSTAIGHSAMRYFSDSDPVFTTYNVAVGYEALRGSTTASSNTGTTNSALGYQAMRVNTSGANNVAVGSYAMYSNTTGSYNTAIGERSLLRNTSGKRNSAISAEVLRINTTGSYNSGGGMLALRNNQTGNYNTAFGYYAGNDYNGDNNTFLGALSDAASAGLSNATAIGYMATVDSSNKVVIGNASVTSNGGQVAWTSYSDERIKKDVGENVPGLEFINELRPVTFHYDVDKQNEILGIDKVEASGSDYEIENIEFTGFMAQEVDAAAKSIGYEFSGVDRSGKLLGLRYSSFVVPLVKGMQEQQEVIQEMETAIEEKDQEIKELLARLNDLEKKVNEILIGSTQHEDLKYDGPWIKQNYPNPFQGRTQIEYYIPVQSDRAEIAFYNINGSKIKVVEIEAFGQGVLNIDGSELSPGAYSYELIVDDVSVAVKKMVSQRD